MGQGGVMCVKLKAGMQRLLLVLFKCVLEESCLS